jgi:hypothetical protein
MTTPNNSRNIGLTHDPIAAGRLGPVWVVIAQSWSLGKPDTVKSGRESGLEPSIGRCDRGAAIFRPTPRAVPCPRRENVKSNF